MIPLSPCTYIPTVIIQWFISITIGQAAMNVSNETHIKVGLSRKELLAVVDTLRRAVEHWRGLYIGISFIIKPIHCHCTHICS